VSFTVRQLEIFVAVAQEGNFARAAARLEISQPAVSEHIRALESRLGYSLFQRRRGTTALLSLEGGELLTRARALLRESAQITRLPLAASSESPATLRVYAGAYLLDCRIRPKLQHFCQQYPHIQLDFVRSVSRSRVVELVRRKRLDLAVFATLDPKTLPRHAEVLHQVPCSIIGAPVFAAAARDVRAIGDLPFVLPLESSREAEDIAKMLRGLSVVPRRVVGRSQYLDVVKKMVEAGKGLGVLFDEQVVDELAAGWLARIGPALPPMSRIILRQRDTKNPSVLALEGFLRSILSVPR
jgi:LysR family transcriptional regulator, low CO2-responsive transcriptional regulator